MKSNKTGLVVNSIAFYVAAFLLTTIIHELAHAVSGLLLGSDPVLHHNYVEHLSEDSISASRKAVIAMSGPFISLMQGVLAAFLFYKYAKYNASGLFLLWFCVLGLFNFLGYLLTGPIFVNGDVGKTLMLLEIPLWIQISVALFGAVFLLLTAYLLTEPFLKFSYREEWVNKGKSRKNFSFFILILPWLIGSGIVTLLYLPIIAIVSIIYPITSGMVLIFPWQNAESIQKITLSENNNIGKISYVGLLILIILILGFRLILLPGIPL